MRILIVNPLRAALEHYEVQLIDVLSEGGAIVDAIGTLEPSVSGASALSWLREHGRLLRSAKSTRHDRVISCWPVLGYLDLVAARALSEARTSVVLHDPTPLVHARGYDYWSRSAGQYLSGQGVEVIVHSEAAERVIATDAPRIQPVRLPLPMLEPRPRAPLAVSGQRLITVIGQFKPDRDVGALERIAAEAPANWTLEIHGRGWPDIVGWLVNDTFLSEEAFAERIQVSDVVLIPYKRFFQSAIAVRCLEAGTPFVGPRDSSLHDLLGESPWLVSDGEWVRAIEQAVGAEPGAVAARSHARVVDDWRRWIEVT